MVLNQQPDLLQQVVAEHVGPRHRRLVHPGPGDEAVGQPGIDQRVRARRHPHEGIGRPHPRLRRLAAQIGLEGGAQEGGVALVDLLDPPHRGLRLAEGGGGDRVGRVAGRVARRVGRSHLASIPSACAPSLLRPSDDSFTRGRGEGDGMKADTDGPGGRLSHRTRTWRLLGRLARMGQERSPKRARPSASERSRARLTRAASRVRTVQVVNRRETTAPIGAPST